MFTSKEMLLNIKLTALNTVTFRKSQQLHIRVSAAVHCDGYHLVVVTPYKLADI